MLNLTQDPKICIKNNKDFSLKTLDTNYKAGFYSEDELKDFLNSYSEKIAGLQEKLYAQNQFSLLLVLQAIDAAGKDSCIKHVFTGVNPQGVHVVNFKQPSKEELDHDFMWRIYKNLPERGLIGVFNRSHYEEVIVTKVHPEYLINQTIPNVNSIEDVNDEFWQNRYNTINQFEKHLHDNGTIIIKVFLNLSKEEQKQRFIDRIETPKKNWKFSYADLKERKRWDDYQVAFEEMIKNTSTDYAPWHVVPSDNQWISRAIVSEILLEKLEGLNLKYPKLSKQEQELLNQGLMELNAE
jgi:PPK2 family polyphosphate:nucleotide phosphotransferase